MLHHGMSDEGAKTTADVLVTTDLWGINTHGSKQLRLLLRNVREGGISAEAIPEIATEGPAWAMVDGNFAMPMVTSTMAMRLAVTKACKTGIGYVGVRRSSHFGAAGYYANMAAEAGMIGLSMSNVDPCMAATGGTSAALGTNPIAYAVPAGAQYPVILDVATSVGAVSKVFAAKTLGKQTSPGWLLDKDGLPTTDPDDYLDGGVILPFAGHKGYGFAVLAEVLSAVLTGAMFTLDVKCWVHDFSIPVNEGHAFFAIDIGQMMEIDAFKERMDKMIRQIKNAPRASGVDEIFLPGEMEWKRRESALENGIELPEDVELSLRGLAEDLDLDPIEVFG